jgi:putative peptidoglycan lipid II flippase
MAGATAVSRLLGFVRVLVVAAVLGTTYLGNTFLAANAVSNVLFELLAAGALSAVLVPAFVSRLEADDLPGAERLAGGILGLSLGALALVSVAGMVGSGVLARILTSGAGDPAIVPAQRALAAFLLVFFVPQVLCYAFGAVATAVLHARRRFVVTAVAPMANSVVMIASLVVFAAVVGPDPGLDLDLRARLLLVTAGTGGVLAFVGVLVVAVARSGFRLRPHWGARDPEVRRLLGHSTWGLLLNASAGALLGAALIAGNGVAGGVVAYQVAYVFFLAPYAILAQPISTTVLPELTGEADAGDWDAFGRSLRWSLGATLRLVVPATMALVVLAQPAMDVVTFGAARDGGPALIAAGLAALGLGLAPYACFMLLARACYALGDSRTPAIVAWVGAGVGVAVMFVGAAVTAGSAQVAVLGLGHSVAFAASTLILWVHMARRVGTRLMPREAPAVIASSVAIGGIAWLVFRVVDPTARPVTVLMLGLVGTLGLGAYVGVLRRVVGTERLG